MASPSPRSSKSDNDHDDRDSDDGSVASSATSTVVYSQEPYSTYQTRVLQLLSALYDPKVALTAELTRLEGGGYNRIIGVVINTGPSTREDLILRIPRWGDNVNVARNVRLLRGLSPFLPVPEVVQYYASSSNALDSPYVLMRRMHGQTLSEVIHDLSFEERCDMSRQVAQLLAKIHTVPIPSGIGFVSANEETGALCVERLPDGPMPSWVPDDEHSSSNKEDEEKETRTLDRMQTPIPTTLRDFVSSRLSSITTYCLSQDPPDDFIADECDRLLQASSALLALPDSNNNQSRLALFHRDFASRNILVARLPQFGSTSAEENRHSSSSTNGGWTIKGILDWDDCESAPLTIAYTWPGWLWSSADEGLASFEENEWDPDLPVPNEECERIKEAFVEEIERLEPRYLEVARETRDRCLRPIYERARAGWWSDEHVKDVTRVVEAAQRLGVLVNDGTPVS